MGTAPNVAYPNGRCPACGWGINAEEGCCGNLDCQERRYGLTRAEQEAEKIYTTPQGQAFWTPDGEGRIWYDTLAEAIADVGEYPVVELEREPEDW